MLHNYNKLSDDNKNNNSFFIYTHCHRKSKSTYSQKN